jgi:hypothetical protein
LLEEAQSRPNPNNATMQYHLGMVYSKLKDKEQRDHTSEKGADSGAGFADGQGRKSGIAGTPECFY